MTKGEEGGVEARVEREGLGSMRFREGSGMARFGTGRGKRRGLVGEERVRGLPLRRGEGVERASRLRKREIGKRRKKKIPRGTWEEWNRKIMITVHLIQKRKRRTKRTSNKHHQLTQEIKVVDSYPISCDANPLLQTRTLHHPKRTVPPQLRLAKVSPSLPCLPSEIAATILPPTQLSPLSTVPSTPPLTLNLTLKIPYNRSTNSLTSETVHTITAKRRRWYKSPRSNIGGTNRNNKLLLNLNSLQQQHRFQRDCSLRIRNEFKLLVLPLE